MTISAAISISRRISGSQLEPVEKQYVVTFGTSMEAPDNSSSTTARCSKCLQPQHKGACRLNCAAHSE